MHKRLVTLPVRRRRDGLSQSASTASAPGRTSPALCAPRPGAPVLVRFLFSRSRSFLLVGLVLHRRPIPSVLYGQVPPKAGHACAYQGRPCIHRPAKAGLAYAPAKQAPALHRPAKYTAQGRPCLRRSRPAKSRPRQAKSSPAQGRPSPAQGRPSPAQGRPCTRHSK